MRAISQNRLGGPEVLELVDVERPVPGPTQILVRVHAAGVNPVDWKTRETGGIGPMGDPPFILGWDVSGVVEEVGAGASLFSPGDEVFGMPSFPFQAGAYSEYVAAPSRHFVRKPSTLDHVHAAAVPLAGLTVWQSLVDTADIRPGQRVLIHAAAGGVGHLAVQIAKARGAYVIGTASAAKHEFLRGLGADELVDYRTTDFAKEVRDVDVVLDTIGQEYGPRSLKTLRRGGRLVQLTRTNDERMPELAEAAGVTAGFTLAEPDRTGLLALAELVDSGRLRPTIDTVFPLEEAAKAQELVAAGKTTGKVVLSVAE
ncbi:NADP-dependent oxidoreductase [Amycolatopsis lurida]|uniref:NADPH:quinone reductase n=1 Tax=Amycolatopsis lurida NRRL 2430 TaxID=1460371 RepID=A0A2P2FP41_AMYLU|nr:NADP-dependent oxidoreductase [Amycolatopsis lurida]KFU78491.1 NADPH:quinone reductase [Amycolatopsis lurida NRRL 2430]